MTHFAGIVSYVAQGFFLQRTGKAPHTIAAGRSLFFAVTNNADKKYKLADAPFSFLQQKGKLMKTGTQFRFLVWLFLFSGEALSDLSTEITPTDDWSAEAAEARRFGTPIMILFSKEDCGYCERLKSDVLEPLASRGELEGFARIRELDINRGGKIKDFDGEKIRTKIFVNRYDVYATPTLVLVDDQGKPLGTPIVGYNNNPEDYTVYLEYFVNVAYWEPKKLVPLSDECDGPLVTDESGATREQTLADR